MGIGRFTPTRKRLESPDVEDNIRYRTRSGRSKDGISDDRILMPGSRVRKVPFRPVNLLDDSDAIR